MIQLFIELQLTSIIVGKMINDNIRLSVIIAAHATIDGRVLESIDHEHNININTIFYFCFILYFTSSCNIVDSAEF